MPGRVLEQVVDQQPQAGLPAADGGAVAAGQRHGHARMALAQRLDGRFDERREVDVGLLGRRRVAARQRLQAIEQIDEPAVLGQSVVEHRGATLGRRIGMPA